MDRIVFLNEKVASQIFLISAQLHQIIYMLTRSYKYKHTLLDSELTAETELRAGSIDDKHNPAPGLRINSTEIHHDNRNSTLVILNELQRENRELKRANEILRNLALYLAKTGIHSR